MLTVDGSSSSSSSSSSSGSNRPVSQSKQGQSRTEKKEKKEEKKSSASEKAAARAAVAAQYQRSYRRAYFFQVYDSRQNKYTLRLEALLPEDYYGWTTQGHRVNQTFRALFPGYTKHEEQERRGEKMMRDLREENHAQTQISRRVIPRSSSDPDSLLSQPVRDLKHFFEYSFCSKARVSSQPKDIVEIRLDEKSPSLDGCVLSDVLAVPGGLEKLPPLKSLSFKRKRTKAEEKEAKNASTGHIISYPVIISGKDCLEGCDLAGADCKNTQFQGVNLTKAQNAHLAAYHKTTVFTRFQQRGKPSEDTVMSFATFKKALLAGASISHVVIEHKGVSPISFTEQEIRQITAQYHRGYGVSALIVPDTVFVALIPVINQVRQKNRFFLKSGLIVESSGTEAKPSKAFSKVTFQQAAFNIGDLFFKGHYDFSGLNLAVNHPYWVLAFWNEYQKSDHIGKGSVAEGTTLTTKVFETMLRAGMTRFKGAQFAHSGRHKYKADTVIKIPKQFGCSVADVKGASGELKSGSVDVEDVSFAGMKLYGAIHALKLEKAIIDPATEFHGTLSLAVLKKALQSGCTNFSGSTLLPPANKKEWIDFAALDQEHPEFFTECNLDKFTFPERSDFSKVKTAIFKCNQAGTFFFSSPIKLQGQVIAPEVFHKMLLNGITDFSGAVLSDKGRRNYDYSFHRISRELSKNNLGGVTYTYGNRDSKTTVELDALVLRNVTLQDGLFITPDFLDVVGQDRMTIKYNAGIKFVGEVGEEEGGSKRIAFTLQELSRVLLQGVKYFNGICIEEAKKQGGKVKEEGLRGEAGGQYQPPASGGNKERKKREKKVKEEKKKNKVQPVSPLPPLGGVSKPAPRQEWKIQDGLLCQLTLKNSALNNLVLSRKKLTKTDISGSTFFNTDLSYVNLAEAKNAHEAVYDERTVVQYCTLNCDTFVKMLKAGITDFTGVTFIDDVADVLSHLDSHLPQAKKGATLTLTGAQFSDDTYWFGLSNKVSDINKRIIYGQPGFGFVAAASWQNHTYRANGITQARGALEAVFTLWKQKTRGLGFFYKAYSYLKALVQALFCCKRTSDVYWINRLKKIATHFSTAEEKKQNEAKEADFKALNKIRQYVNTAGRPLVGYSYQSQRSNAVVKRINSVKSELEQCFGFDPKGDEKQKNDGKNNQRKKSKKKKQ